MESTMVPHALEGSSMLSRCALKFPPPPPKREEKETVDILWVHCFYFTFLGWLENRLGKGGSEPSFRSVSARRKAEGSTFPTDTLSPSGPKTASICQLEERFPREFEGKFCLELGEMRGVCARKHQHGQKSSLQIFSSCL